MQKYIKSNSHISRWNVIQSPIHFGVYLLKNRQNPLFLQLFFHSSDTIQRSAATENTVPDLDPDRPIARKGANIRDPHLQQKKAAANGTTRGHAPHLWEEKDADSTTRGHVLPMRKGTVVMTTANTVPKTARDRRERNHHRCLWNRWLEKWEFCPLNMLLMYYYFEYTSSNVLLI